MSDRGNFFAIDRPTWAYVCGLGMNQAVTYLVLASFTGPDNRTTAASVQAVEKYSGISRGRAKQTIASLLVSVLRQTRPGTRPEYVLLPAAEILGVGGGPPEPSRKRYERNEAFAVRHQVWVEQVAAATRGTDLIWLPNSLVTGAAV
ncbi:MAG: hypothetical protein IH977_08185 [Nitrospinae bacterium]|nr:hypothetical protein [Nitrospinota bacterium]